MPRYFFKTMEGADISDDLVGIDCTDDATAVDMGLEGLADLAREESLGAFAVRSQWRSSVTTSLSLPPLSI